MCIVLLSISLTVGFFAGTSIATYRVLVRDYLYHELYFLFAYTFADLIITSIAAALSVVCITALIVALSHGIVRLITAPVLRQSGAKLLSVVSLGFVVVLWGIIRIHQNWGYFAPGKYHIKIFTYDAAIVLCVLFLGWVVMRISLEKLLIRVEKLFIVFAACVVVIGGGLKGALFIYAYYCLPESPNIVLISIDALRADHVGCYGYKRNTTPHIDAFARQSVLFKSAFVHRGWTLPSHMSMLTGLYGMTHGVGADVTGGLPSRILTVAEFLKNAGYATFGFESCGLWMSSYYGFGRGFDVYGQVQYYHSDTPARNAEFQNRFIQKKLKNKKFKKNFIFIHYFDVHSDTEYLPYDAPPPYSSLFVNGPFDLFAGAKTNYRASQYLASLSREKVMPEPQQLEYIIGLYDNGIAYMDKCISDLFNMLRQEGLYDSALIIITADHGEAFGEHGYFVHGNPYLYDEEMHVPLIVKLPDSMHEGGVVESLVEMIDITPTILDYTGIQGCAMDGTSLRGFIENSSDPKQYIYGLTSKKSLYIRSREWKLMSDNGLDHNHYRLYDIRNDPGERHNVVLQHPDIEEDLDLRLRARMQESRKLRARLLRSDAEGGKAARATFNLDEDQKERLRSLGYVL